VQNTIESLAVPVFKYNFGIITWHREKIRKLDRKTRKILTLDGQHNSRADIDRLYVPIKEGGGLTQIEAAYITETAKLAEYVEGSEDPLLQIVRTHQHNANASLPWAAHKRAKTRKEKWERKRIPGQFPRNLDDLSVYRGQIYRRLKFGDIKGETESLIVAAQDRALGTNYFKRKVLKVETESKCRLCKQYDKTIDHLTSGCPVLGKNEYIIRRDKVCMHLHYSIYK
jgi:hypothetical protein